MEKENGRENTKKNVRSKYGTEYSGDHNFDYKDPASLTRFVSDAGKITPARISKLSLAQQKQVVHDEKVKISLEHPLVQSLTEAFPGATVTVKEK